MNVSFRRAVAMLIGFALTLVGGVCPPADAAAPEAGQWRGLHVINYGSDESLEALAEELPALAKMGINVLILEINYGFEFRSHPELRASRNPVTREGARALLRACRENGIRLIPQFQCLAHQSWSKRTFPLLTEYPELDLTPGAFPENEGIYCREWDPFNPKVNQIVFALFDELIEVFEADAMHVGMDEVFLLGSEHSPSTKGKNPAEVFAKAVNDYHDYLVKKRGLEMLMWGDRLIDSAEYGYGRWEASDNGTAPAVDLIPKDIIICDWHYGMRDSYPSVPMFIEKGFRVLPGGWRNVEATKALIGYSRRQNNPRMLGHLFTTWSGQKQWHEFPPVIEGLKLLRQEDN